MEDKYLDKTGLAYFWGKIKSYFQANLPSVPSPADSAPLMDGASSVGSSSDYAREDHVHPTDTSRAADNSVVHKTGNESISGTKTFNGGVMVGLGSQLKFETAQEEGAYIEAGDDNGVKTLMFADIEDDSAVRLENIATPVLGTDAANKAYVDSKGDNNLVKLNGRSGQYGVTPWSLCAFAVSTSAILEIMEPFTTSGGINGKPVRQGVTFPIGCKIYYHPDYNGISANTDFTSKEFYSTYDDVDARYTAVTGQSISLYSSSQSGVYLHVTVENEYWFPYFKIGDVTEIIVTPHDFLSGNFYIYLGKTVGSTGYKFQLEDNNPLYYYDGTKLIDWATYQVGMSTPSYTAGDGIGILNNVITHKGWSHTHVLPQDVSINNTASFGFNFTGQSADAPVAGTYVVSAQALVSNPNNIGNQAHFALRYRLASSGGYTIAAATSVTLAPARSSTDGGVYGATSVVLQGVIQLSARPSYLEVTLYVEVETDGYESMLVVTAPISGALADGLDPGATNIIMYRIGE